MSIDTTISKPPYVFCIGDSRTGTTSFHEHAQRLGFNSIHHYEYIFEACSAMAQEEKVDTLIKFIRDSDFNCFSDYPTRSFYAVLHENFPDALFVNTVRSVHSWLASCKSYFGKAGLEIDYEELAADHIKSERSVKSFFKDKNNYCEINICESDSLEVSSRLNTFLLGHDTGLIIGNANQSKDSNFNGVDSGIFDSRGSNKSQQYVSWNLTPPSKQFSLYQYSTASLEELATCFQSRRKKACLSEKGHAFLSADSSNGFKGILTGDDSGLDHCLNLFEERRNKLRAIGSTYTVFIVPEKVSIAPDLLPRVFERYGDELQLNIASKRLASSIERELGYVYDLAPYLRDIHLSTPILFRFDSHLNFSGSYFLFSYISEVLKNTFAKDMRRPTSDEWDCKIGTWNGDLLPHLESSELSLVRNAWRRNCHLLPIGEDSPSEQFIHYFMKQDQYIYECQEDLRLRQLHPGRPQLRYTMSSSIRQISNTPIVFLHDSSIDKIYFPLATLSKSTCFYWDKQKLPPLDHEVMLAPGHIVQVVAERFLYSFA